MRWKMIDVMHYALGRILIALLGIVGTSVMAEDVNEYLKKIKLEHGYAVSIGMDSYAFCAYSKCCNESGPIVGIAIWKGDDPTPVDLILNQNQRKQLGKLLTVIGSSCFHMDINGPTIEVHGETVDVIVRRGIFDLKYSDSLGVSKNKKQYLHLINFVRSVMR